MEYRVKRGDQLFGPYTVSALRRFVEIAMFNRCDIVRREGTKEWVPITQVLGDIPDSVLAWSWSKYKTKGKR